MSGAPRSVIVMRVFLVASSVTAAAAVIVAVQRVRHRAPVTAQEATERPVAAGVTRLVPIAAEAGVFRTHGGVLAIDPASDARRGAHPRTLATYRGLREYPGAPPRIPHGLTPVEFQTAACNTCHERGGYSQRFGAYVPVTPHPELRACLQCHVGDARIMSIPLPNTDPSARCAQCHSSGGARYANTNTNWTTTAWPTVVRATRGSNPPPIPHPRQMRENCLACHAAPSAVAEIRTTHPERANCRQCHIEGAPS